MTDFLKQIGGTPTTDGGTVAVFIGTTTHAQPTLTNKAIGSLAFLTNLSTGKTYMTQYVGGTGISECCGWVGWLDVD